MDKVYLIYTDLGYDGIVVEGIATTMESAIAIAEESDPYKKWALIIEEWCVDTYVSCENVRGNMKRVMKIVDGKVVYAIQRSE